MNELLRDLINTEKVAAFIDDVIVGTEEEERRRIQQASSKNNKKVRGKRLVCKTGKVQVEGERSRVFRSGNWTRGDKDGRGKDERCIRLADTKVKDVQKFLGLVNYYR